MKIIKRNGAEEVFDIKKIVIAVTKADSSSEGRSLTDSQIEDIAEFVEFKCNKLNRAVSVEEIQDLVEDQIMATGAFELAKRYVRYRYKRSLVRKANTTDNRILSLIECNNEDVKQENSNKNPAVNSVQRDYMAGEVSRDLTQRMLLPEDIVEADKEGIIHFHDSDYYAQHMHNCDLVNLEDMLQNGTVISGTMIEKPHSFSTACNIATQIIAQVASNQYGGQSISLAHLAPFVQVSRDKIRAEVLQEMEMVGIDYPKQVLNDIVEGRLKKEIIKGVQTIEYQVITLMTTNGQAPFLTVFMYLNEAKDEREKKDLAMIIEETLKQRYKGVKNEAGVWVTPAFPKLIYVLEEDNIDEGSPYFYLTELAAKWHGAVATKIIEKNHLHLVPSLVITKSYPALAVHDTQPKLQRMINEVVRNMSEDGTIGRLQNKWITEFARNRSLEYVFHQNEVFYITFILGIIIVLCITAGYWEVDRRQEKYIRTLLEYQEKLQQSNEETKRANQAKSEFLSHMSHDIRTPINGIMGMVEIIKKNLDDPERIKDCLEKIDKASHHLLSLINDVLDMSKIGSGKVHLEEIPVDLDEEMEKIHAIADVQAKKQEIRFSIEDEVVHRQFLGSPAHLRRILLNLISNALRYNKKGGKICLAIREVEYDGSHIGLEFKVQDTGIGMSREFVEKSLFKPFTQEDDRVRTEYRGTGLGMSIVYELVKQMNGTIDVNSKPGEGTTFTVKLAFKTVDSAWKKKEIQGENRNITGMNILAAEDNQLNMEILQFLLEEAGAKVTAVSDGKQAVEYFADAASGTYDVILMDIMMPVMDGLEASKKIRELPEGKGKDIPIIAMTANAFVEDKEKTKEAGMNAHLTKPVNREEIIRVLAAYWKNKG